ncbi:DNA-binding protein [Pedobacter sp. MC2016-15]|uniref:PPC domain-containing DNA-binding protein n=1 Tax=Pedobacter sp. MC2016-15 TaxID=2994473 RepID=UPI0022459478|nr:PPC domain-containing DNA-binding protein [Pedobacter sp. MC2016-15]MCX2481510.1 DNA-binding protein [Pedobacter sp. MC2016-15]
MSEKRHIFPLMKRYYLILLLALIGFSSYAQTADTARYIKTATGYLMVLRQGDDVFKEIEKLATAEKIPSANFTGMGFVNAKFGFFDFKTKEYKPKDFKEVELASMNGSIAWQKGQPSLHVHGVVTDASFKAFGGHLLSATVSTGSLEITVIVHDKKLERKMEEPLGANVLQLQ